MSGGKIQRPKDFYSRNPEEFDQKYGDFADLSDKFEKIFEDFCSEIQSGRILDAGCGSGRDTEKFYEKGFETTGIDIAEGMIEYCKRERKGDFKRMDMRELDFGAKSFNGVWAAASIFFMNRDEMKQTLSEFRRVLKKNGMMYVCFKEGEGVHVKENSNRKVNEHLINEVEAVKITEESGFEVENLGKSPNPKPKGHDFINLIGRPKDKYE